MAKPRMHIQELNPQWAWGKNQLGSFSGQPHRRQGDAHGFQAVRPEMKHVATEQLLQKYFLIKIL